MHSFLFTEHTSADKELLNWLYVIVSSMKAGVNTREQYNVKCCQNETDFILDLFIQVKMCQCVCPGRFMIADAKRQHHGSTFFMIFSNRRLTSTLAGDDKHSSLGGQNQTGERRHKYTSKQTHARTHTYRPVTNNLA